MFIKISGLLSEYKCFVSEIVQILGNKYNAEFEIVPNSEKIVSNGQMLMMILKTEGNITVNKEKLQVTVNKIDNINNNNSQSITIFFFVEKSLFGDFYGHFGGYIVGAPTQGSMKVVKKELETLLFIHIKCLFEVRIVKFKENVKIWILFVANKNLTQSLPIQIRQSQLMNKYPLSFHHSSKEVDSINEINPGVSKIKYFDVNDKPGWLGRKVMIWNVGVATEEQLNHILSEYGELQFPVIKKQSKNNKTLYGTAIFKSSEAACQATSYYSQANKLKIVLSNWINFTDSSFYLNYYNNNNSTNRSLSPSPSVESTSSRGSSNSIHSFKSSSSTSISNDFKTYVVNEFNDIKNSNLQSSSIIEQRLQTMEQNIASILNLLDNREGHNNGSKRTKITITPPKSIFQSTNNSSSPTNSNNNNHFPGYINNESNEFSSIQNHQMNIDNNLEQNEESMNSASNNIQSNKNNNDEIDNNNLY